MKVATTDQVFDGENGNSCSTGEGKINGYKFSAMSFVLLIIIKCEEQDKSPPNIYVHVHTQPHTHTHTHTHRKMQSQSITHTPPTHTHTRNTLPGVMIEALALCPNERIQTGSGLEGIGGGGGGGGGGCKLQKKLIK